MASPQRCRLFVKANSLLRVLIYSLVVKSVDHAADRDYGFIVCATKCVPEVLATSILLEPLLSRLSSTSQTTIVLLQNGIGIETIYKMCSIREISLILSSLLGALGSIRLLWTAVGKSRKLAARDWFWDIIDHVLATVQENSLRKHRGRS